MKVAGIIAEYNPLHNGHQYQIDTLRRQTGADYIIVAMSGDFLQRGVPALLDKYERTQMALHAGADLVLELPAIWATSSAEFFASAGVQLLGQTGVVDFLCYGCEENEPALMQALVSKLIEEPEDYTQLLSARISAGESYPVARAKALCGLFDNFSPDQIHEFLSSPNNILALEYEKAIALWNAAGHRPLSSHPILRVGSGYHSTTLDSAYASATAIRHVLAQPDSSDFQTRLSGKVPDFTLSALNKARKANLLLYPDAFSSALYTRLWSFQEAGYSQFADCSQSLSNKIQNQLNHYMSYTQFAELLKSREITYTRVCRALTHILLDIRKKDCRTVSKDSRIPYLRILGFRQDAANLLSIIKKEASVPLVTKVADASHQLNPNAMQILTHDIRTADLYRSIAEMQSHKKLPNEYTQGLSILRMPS